MFILGRNILSETMRMTRVPEVAAWMDGQDEYLLFTTCIAQAEIFSGLAIVADGRRRRELDNAARTLFEAFDGRIPPYDTGAANAYAEIYAMRRKAGWPMTPLDLMIASIARSRGARMVTRDAGDFAGCCLTPIDP